MPLFRLFPHSGAFNQFPGDIWGDTKRIKQHQSHIYLRISPVSMLAGDGRPEAYVIYFFKMKIMFYRFLRPYKTPSESKNRYENRVEGGNSIAL